MVGKCSRLFVLASIGALVLVSGCQTSLDGFAKRRVLNAVGRTISKKAYAHDVDFSQERWRELYTDEQSLFDEAETDEDFAEAIQTVLDEYGLSHLDCYSAARAANRRHGRRTGIGVLGVELDDGILAAGVVAGSPAEEAGIKRGDLILSVDGAPARKRKQFRGETGQVRQLEWLHDGMPKSADVVQARFRRASPDELTWLDDDIAWIKVHSFSKSLYRRRQVEGFFKEAADAQGVILDLRGNLGGYVHNVSHLAGQVLDRKTCISVIIYRDTVAKFRRKNPDAPGSMAELIAYTDETLLAAARLNHVPYRGKLVVLVDSLSGSGGELLPAALQELGRAEVIGAVSFGKVLLATTYGLPRGFRLHVPIGEIVTPGGQRIEGTGVQPNVLLTHRETADDDHVIALAREAILR